MINIEFNPNAFTLDIKGHAGHGEKGKDIVCSAISILFYTLAESLHSSKHMLAEEIDFNDADGNGHISCVPKKEYDANISLIFWTILKGLEIVALHYEENVNLSVVGVQ
jgi:uncharacterized protein YsxB (DUF464 family)